MRPVRLRFRRVRLRFRPRSSRPRGSVRKGRRTRREAGGGRDAKGGGRAPFHLYASGGGRLSGTRFGRPYGLPACGEDRKTGCAKAGMQSLPPRVRGGAGRGRGCGKGPSSGIGPIMSWESRLKCPALPHRGAWLVWRGRAEPGAVWRPVPTAWSLCNGGVLAIRYRPSRCQGMVRILAFT